MANKANTIDLGELQDGLESAERRLKTAQTRKTNAYNAYIRACKGVNDASAAHDSATRHLRVAVDALTV